jgi:hypothetical protein
MNRQIADAQPRENVVRIWWFRSGKVWILVAIQIRHRLSSTTKRSDERGKPPPSALGKKSSLFLFALTASQNEKMTHVLQTIL